MVNLQKKIFLNKKKRKQQLDSINVEISSNKSVGLIKQHEKN